MSGMISFGLTGSEKYLIRRLRMNGSLDVRSAGMLADDGGPVETTPHLREISRVMIVGSDEDGWPFIEDPDGVRVSAPAGVDLPYRWCRDVAYRLETAGIHTFRRS